MNLRAAKCTTTENYDRKNLVVIIKKSKIKKKIQSIQENNFLLLVMLFCLTNTKLVFSDFKKYKNRKLKYNFQF